MEVLCAKNYAREKHMGQKYGCEDYFETHVESVVESVKKSLLKKESLPQNRNDMLIAVAYLHDTVEDSDATVEDIRDLFGLDVSDAVDAITHRAYEGYQEYISRVLENDLARFVKYHDIMFNLNKSIEDYHLCSGSGEYRVNKYLKALHQFGVIL